MKKRPLILALVILIAIGVLGAFGLGLFDDSPESPSLQTKNQSTSSSVGTSATPSNRTHDQPNKNEPDPEAPVEPVEIVERELTFELAIDSGVVPAESLELSFEPSLQNGSTVNAEVGEGRRQDDFYVRPIALHYRGPETEALSVAVAITAPDRKPASGEFSVNLSGDNAPILLRVAYGVTLRGAVYVQGGAAPFAGAKVKVGPTDPSEKRRRRSRRIDGVESVLAEAREEGIRDTSVVDCSIGGSFELASIAPGRIVVSACYPDGKTAIETEAEVYSDMIEGMDDTPREEREDPRISGDYSAIQYERIDSGDTRDEIWLGLSLLSTLSFRVTNPIKGDCNIKLYAEDVSDDGMWEAYGMGRRDGKSIALAEDGRGELSGLTPKVGRVVLQPLGYQPREFLVEIIAGLDIDLGNLSFSEAYELRGRVLDSMGKGIEGVQVVVGTGVSDVLFMQGIGEERFQDGAQSPTIGAVSAENGSYSISELHGESILVGVQHETFRFLPARIELNSKDRVIDFDIVLAAPGSIRGKFSVPDEIRKILVASIPTHTKVSDDYSAPTSPFDVRGEAQVELLALNSIFKIPELFDYSEPGFQDRKITNAELGSNGEFEIADVALGQYELIGEIAGIATRFARVTVKAGEVSEVTLEFRKPWRLHGRITGRDGAPYANRHASLSSLLPSEDAHVEFQTGTNGDYDVRGLTPSTYRFGVEGEFLLWDQELTRRRSLILGEAETREFNLDLSESHGTRFQGKITVNGRKAFTLAWLSTTAGSGVRPSVRPIFLREDDFVDIRDVAPGQYHLRLTGNTEEDPQDALNYVVAHLTLQAKRVGEEIDISHDFKAGPVRGSVTLPAGVDATLGVIRFFEISKKDIGEDVLRRFSGLP